MGLCKALWDFSKISQTQYDIFRLYKTLLDSTRLPNSIRLLGTLPDTTLLDSVRYFRSLQDSSGLYWTLLDSLWLYQTLRGLYNDFARNLWRSCKESVYTLWLWGLSDHSKLPKEYRGTLYQNLQESTTLPDSWRLYQTLLDFAWTL